MICLSAGNGQPGAEFLTTEEIAGLLQPFLEQELPERSLVTISTYIDLLMRWNARINLTAIRAPREIVTRHFGESLFLARHLFPPEGKEPVPIPNQVPGLEQGREVRVIDIGSGAGFPGLPLKIWAPAISVTLVESNHKKAAFLREVCRLLTLTNVNVLTARAETLVAPADLVILRAVERFDTILPTAARLVSPGGRLALLIGASQVTSASLIGLQSLPPIPIPQSDSRVLSINVRPL